MSRVSPADLLLLVVVLVWGTDFAVLKWPLAKMHPHVANALRFVVSAGVLGAVYGFRCWHTGSSFFGPIRTHWHTVVPLGLLGFGAFPASLMVGLNHTTAGSAALIMATNPLWTAVLGWPAKKSFRQRLQSSVVAAAVVTAAYSYGAYSRIEGDGDGPSGPGSES